MELRGKRIWVAGHNGMVGSAVLRRLAREDAVALTVSRSELDLRDPSAVAAWMQANRPEVVVLAAAKVGGIWANDTFPAEFIYDNLAIELSVINSAAKLGVEKLLFLGSSCVYPKLAPQPINEDALLTGPLEPTNEWYAVAKIAGIKLCQAYRRQGNCDFITAMPTNLYGPGDNYRPEESHVPAALIRRMHEAKIANSPTVTIWGTGQSRREFLCVDDLADACVHLLKFYGNGRPVNVGTGKDISILAFAEVVAGVVGYEGMIKTDPSRPDGAPRKLLDVSAMTALGWTATTPLREGLAAAYQDFLSRFAAGPPSVA